MTRKTAVVIAPGRGTYNADELGYLARHHADKTDIITAFDMQRKTMGQESIAALDSAKRFSLSKFTRGDNASSLIYACSYLDFLSIEQSAIDVVAVTGNSMGWYTALACSGAVTGEVGFRIVNTMGTLMQDAMIGGQLLYPFVDGDWIEIPGKKEELLALTQEIDGLYISILLGGMIVFGGTQAALKVAEHQLPPTDRFPMRLANHAAFHTPLQEPISVKRRAALGKDLFIQPKIPLIDGEGHIWMPKACNLRDLWNYTFNHQVTQPYSFTKAVTNALKEFAPDCLILLGPGATLGGATAQTMIQDGWLDLRSKTHFANVQKDKPYLFSMGMVDQLGARDFNL